MENIKKQFLKELKNSFVDFNIDTSFFFKFVRGVIKGKNLDDFLSFIGNGSFKEAYRLGENHVVKFCSDMNDTNSEKSLLEIAKAEGIDFAFIPTKFINIEKLQNEIFLERISQFDYEYACEWDSAQQTFVNVEYCSENQFATEIEIQPFAILKENSYWDYYKAYGISLVVDPNRDTYEENLVDPLYNPVTNKAISFKTVYNIGIHDKEWLSLFIERYGVDNFYKLSDFIRSYKIKDLHSGNVGYIKKNGIEYPIILDWISTNSNNICKIYKEKTSIEERK